MKIEISADQWWIIFGLLGQFLFFMRFVVQWIQSERKKESVIPVSFWYLGVGGAGILFFYALHNHDPVFSIGCFISVFIYARNLQLIKRKKPVKSLQA